MSGSRQLLRFKRNKQAGAYARALADLRVVKRLGTRLRQARRLQGLTLTQVAHVSGVYVQQISEIERGLKPAVPLSKVWRLAVALGVSLDSLVGLRGTAAAARRRRATPAAPGPPEASRFPCHSGEEATALQAAPRTDATDETPDTT